MFFKALRFDLRMLSSFKIAMDSFLLPGEDLGKPRQPDFITKVLGLHAFACLSQLQQFPEAWSNPGKAASLGKPHGDINRPPWPPLHLCSPISYRVCDELERA